MSMFRTNEMYKHSYLRLCFDNRSLHLNISWVVTCKLLSKKGNSKRATNDNSSMEIYGYGEIIKTYSLIINKCG